MKERRIRLLECCIAHTEAVAEGWVQVVCHTKKLDPNEPPAGEEWLSGPLTTIRNLRQFTEPLAQRGCPKISKMTRRRNGQWVA